MRRTDSPIASNGYRNSVSPRGRRYSRSRSRSKSHSRRYRSRSGSRDFYRRSPGYGYRSSGRKRFLGPRENPTPSRCLGVFGLSLHTQERNLYDIFSQYGNIEDVQLVFDNYTGRSRGFGFVYFTHVADAKAAKADAHGMEIDGRPIRCDFSITERPHSPTPGIYMGRPSRRPIPRRRSISPRGRYSRSRSRSRSYDRRY
ncbi:Transformer-2 proteineta isoform 4 [Schistosoma japonicum]|uniref:RRM domain-containing protein n=2 Tax=Schistosoma TaxID=6181 RepID=A0AAE1ZIG8_SCHME|nr:SJCHGC01035 protein [Schistosoma japonicum]KAK4474616.1 hypothetical protein MN116_001753 [Schistosoma mekongi]KAH8866930.1 Transformer-2 protein likeeta [Schistosoma japonicum]TNN20314.1 Transformer-2 proteineta isoform 4 [Schistosoma japonicum]CAX71583.1 Splicing factor, arginine/serine-rich 10 [Schistosoma japonicum]